MYLYSTCVLVLISYALSLRAQAVQQRKQVCILWLEAFAATKCNKIFSGDQPRQNWTTVQRFRGPVCLHHQGMMRWLESESRYNWRSVSQSVLVSSPVWDSWPDFFDAMVVAQSRCAWLQMLKTVAWYKWRCMIGCWTKMIGPLWSEFSRRSDFERLISSWTVPQSHWSMAVQEGAYIEYISNMQRFNFDAAGRPRRFYCRYVFILPWALISISEWPTETGDEVRGAPRK
jgi:hypothetical protein